MKKVTFREFMKFADQISIDCTGERDTKLGTLFVFNAKDIDKAFDQIVKKYNSRLYVCVSGPQYAPEIKQIGVILLSQKVLDMKHTINLKNQ